MGLGGYAAEIARMAGYPPDHPRLLPALGYAESVLTQYLGHLEDRQVVYSPSIPTAVRYIALPPGELVASSVPGRLVRPGLFLADAPVSGQVSFTVRQNWTGENPLVLRAAAALVAAYLALPDTEAKRFLPPEVRTLLAQLVGTGVVG